MKHKYPSHIKRQKDVPGFGSYRNAKGRCENAKHKRFADYGARGIRFEWPTFRAFYSDMGAPPTKEHTLERLDNDGNYSASNCAWKLPTVQNRNKRNSIKNRAGDGWDLKPWQEKQEATRLRREQVTESIEVLQVELHHMDEVAEFEKQVTEAERELPDLDPNRLSVPDED